MLVIPLHYITGIVVSIVKRNLETERKFPKRLKPKIQTSLGFQSSTLTRLLKKSFPGTQFLFNKITKHRIMANSDNTT